jgi:hypothetical protein
MTRVPGRMQKEVVRDQPSSGQVQQHNARFTCTLVAFAALLLRFVAVSGQALLLQLARRLSRYGHSLRGLV